MPNLRFTAFVDTTCDCCSANCRNGYFLLNDDVQGFVCTICAPQVTSPAEVQMANDIHKQACFEIAEKAMNIAF